MATKRFSECVVFDDVYVSSSYHTFITIVLKGRKRAALILSSSGLEYEKGDAEVRLPAYAYGLMADALRAVVAGDTPFRMYEYNQWEQKRFSDLRYAPTLVELNESVLWWADKFEKRANGEVGGG